MTTDHDRDDDRALFWEAFGNTFRPYAGWVLFGFGALLVLLGYIGISGESVVAKQLPYLISGGIGGILLAVLGAYFLGIDELRRDSGRLDRMERQLEELHRALLEHQGPVDEVGRAPAVAVVPAEGLVGEVVVVDSGETFHRAGCALAAGKEATSVPPELATQRGLRPCPVCEPVVPAA